MRLNRVRALHKKQTRFQSVRLMNAHGHAGSRTVYRKYTGQSFYMQFTVDMLKSTQTSTDGSAGETERDFST